MNYINQHVTTYVDKAMENVEPLLKEIRLFGSRHHIPIIGNDGAAFLKSQVVIKKPLKILEIGTAIGYSGSMMLLNSNAILDTIEISDTSYQIAKDNFEKLNLSQRVKQYLGDADVVLDDLIARHKRYDFIFIDAAKGQYLNYFKKCEALITEGGIIVADNVLYNGIVADLPHPRRNRTIYTRLREFINYVVNHLDYESALLTIGDGILIAIRKEDDEKS